MHLQFEILAEVNKDLVLQAFQAHQDSSDESNALSEYSTFKIKPMKNNVKLLLGVILVFLLSSCLKENHTIRIRNNYNSAITKADAGNANYGEIGTGAYSSYESINTGDFT